MIESFGMKEMVEDMNMTQHEKNSDLDAAETGQAVSFVDKIILARSSLSLTHKRLQ